VVPVSWYMVSYHNCERFHKTGLQGVYQSTLRKSVYESIDELQKDLDVWLDYYNNRRTHQGKICCGITPMETLLDGKRICKEKYCKLDLTRQTPDQNR
jgi:hypothetical protein